MQFNYDDLLNNHPANAPVSQNHKVYSQDDKDKYSGYVTTCSLEQRISAAEQFIADQPILEAGNDRTNNTLKLASKILRGFAIGDQERVFELLKRWNERGDGWSDGELRNFVKCADSPSFDYPPIGLYLKNVAKESEVIEEMFDAIAKANLRSRGL
jgi:hypothetical protein